MIRFEKPRADTLQPFFELDITPTQIDARLVAPNVFTLAQAAYEPGAEVWFIYDDNTPVGLSAMVDFADPNVKLDPGDDPNGFYLWRLMIDEHHQDKGYGKAAVAFAIDRARALGRAGVYLTAQPDGPTSPLGFYKHLGFAPTGRISNQETEMVMTL